ncbi:MAG: adenine deaminase [Bacteroidales bacterium]
MSNTQKISGNIVDVVRRRIYRGTIIIEDAIIIDIEEGSFNSDRFILPGFIDSHVHIESSMLIPSEFARLAVVQGTVGTVSDPHEMANVLGIPGVQYMLRNAASVPFHFNFGAPSCVPATPFETSGAVFGIRETEELLAMPEIRYLSEMMNFPGVIAKDPEVMGKLELARKYHKPVDGHAPGLKGEEAIAYASAGISTDHECFTLEEAEDKIRAGMKILIREGSAARNFDTLIPLISDYPDKIMFCSDDKHPDNLVAGHINLLARRAIEAGYDWMSVLRCCSFNPIKHYKLKAGLLQKGDSADFIIVDSLTELNILETWIKGIKVSEQGKTLITSVHAETPNVFNAKLLELKDLEVVATGENIRVQRALDGQLITESLEMEPRVVEGRIVSDTERDMLKMIVMNRYRPEPPAIDFVNNFGFKSGAIASTVAHDSHNIIAVGTSDEEICNAVNLLISSSGGISLCDGDLRLLLPLAVAGLMSEKDGYWVAEKYKELDFQAKKLGSKLNAPYMTLSFMALLVIPALKLSDKGLFDGKAFTFTELFIKKC